MLNRLRTIFSFPVFLGCVLAGCVSFLIDRSLADPDIWWHLRNAEYLLKNHHFIRSDMYSFTVAGSPWMNHEWLAEIPYYLGWKACGLRGIFVVMVCLIEAVMLGIYRLSWVASGNSKSAFVATWVAMFLGTVSFGPRTLLFGWIYMIILLSVLWRYKRDGRANLWILPPLFLLWINSHGSWLIGLVVLGIFILAGLVEFSTPALEATRWTRAQWKRLLTIAGLCVAALFINPYGYRLVMYPFEFAFRQKLNVSNVEEWASTDFHGLRGKVLLAAILITVILTVVRGRRWRLESLALFTLAVYSSVTYMRFIFLAGIILSPILAERLDNFPPYEREKDKPLINAAFVVLTAVFMVWRFPSTAVLAGSVDKVYPTQAVTFLESRVHQKPGRVLNDYLFGGYLILNCRDIPVFIDSRVDIFEYHGIVKEYLDFLNLRGTLELTDKYDIHYVMLSTDGAQAYFFRHVPGWNVIYKDVVATVFERAGAATSLAN